MVGTDGPTTLRWRNSISSGVPKMLDLPSKPQSSSFPMGDKALPRVDFEMVSLKPLSYTSLKDLLPNSSGIQSPTCASGSEISIRNRLVKQAAWAYLQPMTASPTSSGRNFFRRMWVRFSDDYVRKLVGACLGFINYHVIPSITGAFDRLLEAFCIGRNSKRGR